MAEVTHSTQSGKKRKKKRSNIQMAKKCMRQRYQGEYLDTETYQYMLKILELMRGDFPSAEERLMFVSNVYEQTVDKEIKYAQNQIGSRILDSLLPQASLEAIQRLANAFHDSLRSLSGDRFASHVLQKIVQVCADRGNQSEANRVKAKGTNGTEIVIEVTENDAKIYNDIVLKLSKYFLNNVEEFVFDTYANHLLRTVLECLGGLIDVSSEKTARQSLSNVERRSVVQEYNDVLRDSCKRLHRWPQFLDFGRDELTSGLLQSALHALKDIDPTLAETYIKKITEECFKPGENQQLSDIFDAECSVRLLETCMKVASPQTFSDIYKKFFAKNLKVLSVSKSANFGVQRLLDCCNTKETFEEIYEELSENLSEIFQQRYTGVLYSVANACERVQAKQGPFVNEMMKILHCDESAKKQLQIVPCTAVLKTYEQLEATNGKIEGSNVNLQGSLIIQAILRFNKPIKIVNSILEMDNENLMHLFNDCKGSRILDAFMESKYIGEKSREKLARKLQGNWMQLAKTTHGSRGLDRMWGWSASKQRLRIMEELAEAGESLRSTKSGNIISSKLNVPLFARNKKDWTESQGKEGKTRALFADIIGNSNVAKN